MQIIRVALAFFLTFSTTLYAQATPADHAYTAFDPKDLAWVKQQVQAHNPQVQPALSALLKKADTLLQRQPKSVIDKKGVANSKDKRDFYSMSKYSWGDDDATKGGNARASVFKDGMRNPKALTEDYDKNNYTNTVYAVNALALAYYLTGKAEYAKKAGDYLRTWFIDPKTRMNPNFRYADFQPGVNDGRSAAVIEGVILVEMLDYVVLLDGSGALSSADDRGLKAWFGEYSKWLVESDFGKQEAKATNNHGSWYCAQVMASSLYSGNIERARTMLAPALAQTKRQFADNGSMPKEMTRANSASYSVYGLRSFIAVARLADYLGQPLWGEKSTTGKPILKTALDFLAPYYSGKAQWKSGSIHGSPDPYTVQVFRLGGNGYHTNEYDGVLGYLYAHGATTDKSIRLLGAPKVIAAH